MKAHILPLMGILEPIGSGSPPTLFVAFRQFYRLLKRLEDIDFENLSELIYNTDMKCERCGKKITGGYLKVDGYVFHPECFTCSKCGKVIGDSFQKSRGKYFHMDCYKEHVGLVCDKCGKVLYDKYVRHNGKRYHVHCHDLRCGICGKPLPEYYLQDGEGNYHESCFKNSKAPRCGVCDSPLMGKYLKDVWGNMAHEYHGAIKTESCEYCGRLMSESISNGAYRYGDGRLICGICKLTAVNDNRRLTPSRRRVLQLLASPPQSFQGIPDGIPIRLVDKFTLNRMTNFGFGDHGLAFTRCDITLKNKRREKLDYHIYVLTGLPQLQFEAVLGHEFMHVWLNEKDIHNRLSNKDMEGFCNLACALVYEKDNSPFGRIKLKQMQDNPDRWYGKGYRNMKRRLQRLGWRRLKASL